MLEVDFRSNLANLKMNEFTEVIESIKQCDILIANMTREGKELESGITSMESQKIQLLNKYEDLKEHIAYKTKITQSKEYEKNFLTQQLKMHEKMLSDAQIDLENEEAKLQESQHDLWKLRIQFTTDVMEFLKENDYLMHNNAKIVQAMQKRKAEKTIKETIRQLEKEILELENQFRIQKSQLDIIEHLKCDKARLEKEPETGAAFKKLQNQIENTLKELNRHDEQNESVNVNLSLATPQPPMVEQVRTFTYKVPSKICNKKTFKQMKEM